MATGTERTTEPTTAERIQDACLRYHGWTRQDAPKGAIHNLFHCTFCEGYALGFAVLESKVEAMQAEGCQAVGAIEDIFNGVTAEGQPTDPVLAKVADIASSVLVDPKPCEHRARERALTEALRTASRILGNAEHPAPCGEAPCAFCWAMGTLEEALSGQPPARDGEARLASGPTGGVEDVRQVMEGSDARGAELERLREAAKCLLVVVGESQGIDGWHLNGALAPWSEFEFVDEFRAALSREEPE